MYFNSSLHCGFIIGVFKIGSYVRKRKWWVMGSGFG
jgi:hypothetical protein